MISEEMSTPPACTETNDQKQSATTAPQTTTEEDNDEVICPLFMEGLPSNFTTNSGLAAIASLLDEETAKPEKDIPTPKSGGGKIRSKSNRLSRRMSPFSVETKKKEKEVTSTAEAQLFIKMWKF